MPTVSQQHLQFLEYKDCLCTLFQNYNNYSEEIKQKLDLMNNYLSDVENELIYRVSSDLGTTLTPPEEGPCQRITNIVNHFKALALNNPSASEIVHYGSRITSLFSQIYQMFEEGERPCGKEPGGDDPPNNEQVPILNIKDGCTCRILGITSEEEEVNTAIQQLRAIIESLKSEIENVAGDLFPGEEFTWPEDPCEQLKKLQYALDLLANDASLLAQTNVVNLQNQFNDQFAPVNTLLQEKGIFACPDNLQLKSDQLYLQAVGSDGVDGSVTGTHLRWSFTNQLGEEHLPKGNLAASGTYATSIGFNKADDFVHLYKIPYNDLTISRTEINLSTLNFGDYNESILDEVYWIFNKTVQGQAIKVMLIFDDNTKYSAAQTGASSPQDIVNNYDDYIRVLIEDRRLFSADFTFNSPSGSSEYEAVSTFDNLNSSSDKVTIRIADSDNPPNTFRKIENEHTQEFRIKINGNILKIIGLEDYTSFYLKNVSLITKLGKYSLSLDDTEVLDRRLEDTINTPGFTINKSWPAFNKDLTVLTSTYIDKWNDLDGIKNTLERYLNLSKTDVNASEQIISDEATDSSTFEWSWLDGLQLMSTDFHIARMLGLGEIDTNVLVDERFIYFAKYDVKELNSESGSSYPTISFSLPTGQADYRLPIMPINKAISYGFSSSGDESDNMGITDVNGYSSAEQVRYIKLDNQEYPYENPGTEFFGKLDRFDMGFNTRTSRIGIDYKESGGQYVKPEIMADIDDPEYCWDTSDNSQVIESVPAFPTDDNSLFVHREVTEGVHKYSLFAINWFNRASVNSPELSTDYTKFKPVTLPAIPGNINIALIQEDQSELFYLPRELSGSFNDKIRLRFDWKHIQNIQHQKAKKIEIYHRELSLDEQKGKIASVTSSSNLGEFLIETELYIITSDGSNEQVKPLIPIGNGGEFIGSFLRTGGMQFEIVGVSVEGEEPTILVRGIENFKTIENPTNPGQYQIVKDYIAPKVGDYISFSQNHNITSLWNKLPNEFTIVHHDTGSDYEEVENLPEGKTRTLTIGGLTENSVVIIDLADPSIPDAPLNDFFRVEFQGTELPKFIDPMTGQDAHWEGGVIRFPDLNAEYEVMEILYSLAPDWLTLLVRKNQDQSEPDYTVTHKVNYHPSYCIYFDTQPSGSFQIDNLKPNLPEYEKTTYIALRSVNIDEIPNLYSDLSFPVELNAKAIIIPQKPPIYADSLFTTRQDAFNKSSYTFTFPTNATSSRVPYGYIFYRGTLDGILKNLYVSATLQAIKDYLRDNDVSQSHNTRFEELINVEIVSDGSGFFQLNTHEGYQLPFPDKPDFSGLSSNVEIEGKIKEEIEKVFIPLQKEPVIFSLIKEGYQTNNAEPKLRTSSGKRLSNSAADRYPNIRRNNDSGWEVKYSDYSINGASFDEYFYFTKEINFNYRFGAASDKIGPIKVVNTNPPEPIKLTSLTNAINLSTNKSAIELQIIQVKEDKIWGFRIYFSRNEDDLLFLDENTAFKNIPYSNKTYFDFEENDFFGETYFFKVSALRMIINENSSQEKVLSTPSKIYSIAAKNLINPKPVQFTMSFDDGLSNNMVNVEATWTNIYKNSTFYLFQMTSFGTWKLLKKFTDNSNQIIIDFSTLSPAINSLDKTDSDNNIIYYRFKIDVENSDGLMNLTEEVVTLYENYQSNTGISFNGSDGMEIENSFIIN